MTFADVQKALEPHPLSPDRRDRAYLRWLDRALDVVEVANYKGVLYPVEVRDRVVKAAAYLHPGKRAMGVPRDVWTQEETEEHQRREVAQRMVDLVLDLEETVLRRRARRFWAQVQREAGVEPPNNEDEESEEDG